MSTFSLFVTLNYKHIKVDLYVFYQKTGLKDG